MIDALIFNLNKSPTYILMILYQILKTTLHFLLFQRDQIKRPDSRYKVAGKFWATYSSKW